MTKKEKEKIVWINPRKYSFKYKLLKDAMLKKTKITVGFFDKKDIETFKNEMKNLIFINKLLNWTFKKNKITYKNGSKILFHIVKPKPRYIDICWVEEAQSIKKRKLKKLINKFLEKINYKKND
jgi:hypothetical protein